MAREEPNLFIFNDSDLDSDIDAFGRGIKKRKVKVENEFQPSDSGSDSDEWDEIPLQTPVNPLEETTRDPSEESFNITIAKHTNVDKEKRKARIREKQVKTSIHHLGLVAYMTHFKKRNVLLSDKKVLRSLKKLLPESFIKGPYKKFRNMKAANFPNPQEADVLFIYVLKYLIKWFRINFKFDSNGIRVLGYLPPIGIKTPELFYPKAATSIQNRHDILKVILRFKHNRDTGAQLFTALLRSLGFESRMIFSLPVLPISTKLKPQPKIDHKKLEINKDFDLLYPYYWSEVVNPLDPGELIVLEGICFHDESKWLTRLKRFGKPNLLQYFTPIFYPVANELNQMWMQYVLALGSDNLMLDVSSRYMSDVSYRWFNKLDLRTDLGRCALLLQSLLRWFNKNLDYSPDANKELNCLREIALTNYTIPDTLSAMKRNPNIVTELNLRYNELIPPREVPIKQIVLDGKKIGVHFKNCLQVGKSETQWKFLGRSVKPQEIATPMKSTTVTFRRSVHNQRVHNLNIANGTPELNETKLFTFAQTCPYIKPRITLVGTTEVLPRNKYGNLEVYREAMVPDGCSWLKLSSIEHILQDYKSGKLKTPFMDSVEYVPVVVGFNFGSMPKAIIPIKQGVIVLNSQLDVVKKIWLYGKIRDDNLRKEEAISGWFHILSKLRIKSRLDSEYGEVG
ncbi:uncharacterized protein CANTADRAFT_55270 [Suhomyces tanzawaensis NRRL Y-17324]|uniref:Rad4-domain-containing protein n=1 Tax=Suhomyces tanzawaensis NRRL Y-17324 TaxID=984487 RepID=A0A1E4SF54_9ASCO|nr:uncharacterized protein CANTADRAFT_55270 [Suhomyces tanzawaensis NRRL Y-17324]ODV78128.1 hypothetical protein CANTADRAFT_55270 [Suhomyces tanzawaensis NRRL Y-17324]